MWPRIRHFNVPMEFQRAELLRANTAAFLSKRSLDADVLREKVLTQYPGAGQILLTSSLTQGLATPTSDIDLIAVTSDPLAANRMATQIYLGSHHCEVMAFSELEREGSLAALSELARRGAGRAIADLNTWDRTQPIARKYLERMINGVSVELTVPNQGHLRDLAAAWALQALQRFVESVSAMRLSMAAGERRAPVSYAVAAVLDAMDAALNCSGYVFSNRKWYASRWAKDAAAAMAGAPPALAPKNLTSLLSEARAGFGSALDGQLADRIEGLVPDLFGWLFEAPPLAPAVVFSQRGEARRAVFGPGARLAELGGTTVLLPDAEPVEGLSRPIASLSNLAVGEARWLLDSLRAGLITIELVE